MKYEEEYKIFSRNIHQAARAFYYHDELEKQIYADCLKYEYPQYSKIYQAVQDNAQFWNDYKHSKTVNLIITLGRIFDKQKKAHKASRLLKIIKTADDFSTENLRKRKIKSSDNYQDWIDDYLNSSHELSQIDIQNIEKFILKTEAKWKLIKPLRNKIFAHEEALSPTEKSNLYKSGKFSLFEEIINELLTLDNILWQAFHNGEKPNFYYSNKALRESAKKDIQSLLSKISNNY